MIQAVKEALACVGARRLELGGCQVDDDVQVVLRGVAVEGHAGVLHSGRDQVHEEQEVCEALIDRLGAERRAACPGAIETTRLI